MTPAGIDVDAAAWALPIVVARAQWPACAYVDPNGMLEALDTGAGLARISQLPELVIYARGLIRSDRPELRFIWIDGGSDWLSVLIYAEKGPASSPKAVLQVEAIDPPFGLTPRELDILTLLAAGFSNETIAARLTVSPRTVAKHVENIFGKTSIWSRAGVAGFATDRGLLRLPTPGGADNYPLGTGVIERISGQLDGLTSPSNRQATRRPIIVGMPLSFSGKGHCDAAEMLNGAILAVEQINQRGGVLGRELQLLTVDCDLGAASSVRQAYSTLIDNEVDAITAGYSCVEPTIQKLVGEFRGPYLHAATMQSVVECVRDDPTGLGNIFQVCASDVNYGLGLARFLADLERTGQWLPRNRRLVILQPFWPGLNIGIDEIDRRLGHRWQIDVISDLPNDDIDWNLVMDLVHGLDPSVVMLASYLVEHSIPFQKSFAERPLPSLVYKLYSPSIPAYCEELGDQAHGVVWATTTGLYSDRIGNKFVLDYRSRFGQAPGQSHAGIAYDRVNILSGTWARVGNSRMFGKVVEDLRTSVYRGINGSYFFGTDGQVGMAFPDDTLDPSISQAHLVFQIQNGEQRILSPSPYANGRFQIPRWLSGNPSTHCD